MKGFRIRTMTLDEVSVAVEWAAQEGWNPGLNDAQHYHSADPNGFWVGELDGEPIGCISVVKYDATFGFLGFYIVKPKYRGQGYGIQIWNQGMAYLEGCNVALDGVVDQQENYKRSGFVLSHRNIRYEGRSAQLTFDSNAIVKATSVDFYQVEDYLNGFFPVARREFNHAWFSQMQCTSLVYVKEGKVLGAGVIRDCHTGYKIAPLFADSEHIANELYAALVSSVEAGKPVFLDVPEVNEPAVTLASSHNMTPCFETARMYTKQPPALSLERTYGVTSFEIG
ncbi:GNAT family N-acetyltransferase [Vibrio wakamikoensis]|uniref:GNAT family N-acetyltransferase n=1 Tax=Vibrio wakamikoensis TaxID=2910251 RepID=UPI003D211FD3